MTTLFLSALGTLAAYAVYIATASARRARKPGDFLDGGLAIPGWATIFAGTGVVIASLGLEDHLLLTATYGLQYSHVALGLILAAIAAALIHGRLAIVARLTGLHTAGALLGSYYSSTAIRLYVLLVVLLLSLPFAATQLAETGALMESATGGAVPAPVVIWACAFFTALFTIIGGWRGMVYVVAGQSLAMLVLLAVTTGTAGAALHGYSFLTRGIAVPSGIVGDRLPGVIQFTAGLGKAVPAGGPWTATQLLSFGIALTGITLSPGFCLLAVSTRSRVGLAFTEVWMIAGIAAGLLLLLSPLLGAEIASTPRPLVNGIAAFASRLANADELLAVGFLLTLVLSQQIAVAFLTTSGASLLTTDLIARYVRPDLDARGQRLAARIAIAFLLAGVAGLATYLPTASAVLASLALSLSAQLLPALLGLCWLRWVTRSGVIAGLVFGMILVLLTEAAGVVAFEGLLIDLPWGRWPLTVHSAAWGMLFNVGTCIIASLWTRRETRRREDADRLHEELAQQHRARLGGRAARAAKWSLTLIWAYLAIGPAAILGNYIFNRQSFGLAAGNASVPSLLDWQVASWLIGVLLVWWLAYASRLGIVEDSALRHVQLGTDALKRGLAQRPSWITRSLGRLASRSTASDRSRA